jgi:hypothetical protein
MDSWPLTVPTIPYWAPMESFMWSEPRSNMPKPQTEPKPRNRAERRAKK